jgi:uncharacterized integral membrane protein
MKKSVWLKVLLILVLAAIILALVIQNLAIAPFNFLFLSFSAPMIAVILIALFIGFSMGILTYTLIFNKEKKQTSSAQNSVNKAQK